MQFIRAFQGVIGFMLLLIIFSTTIDVANAESGQTYQVGTSNLNIRTTPSEDGQVVGQFGYGNKVVVFKEANGWAQTYYKGQEVWVASQYLYLDNDDPIETEATPTKVTVTENNVRIRSGSGTAHSMIGSTNSGESFSLLETNDGWHKVSLSNGTVGWISAALTDNPSKSTNKNNITNVSEDIKQSNGSLKGYNIVLDPGHGGNDPGAIGINGITEKDLILTTANTVAEKLRQAGATVIMTRTNDKYVSLEDRIAISNSYHTHAFISFHYDAYPTSVISGFSTHFYTSFGQDRNLAQSIQSGIEQHVNLNSRGIMRDNYYVLRENSDLAVLVELGFITNPNDLTTIQTTEYQNGVANGITSGLLSHFNK